MKKEIIVRYSYGGVSVDISNNITVCVEDKCTKLERGRAKVLFKRVLQSLEGAGEGETREKEEEVSLFEGEIEAEAEGEGAPFYQTF